MPISPRSETDLLGMRLVPPVLNVDVIGSSIACLLRQLIVTSEHDH